MQYKYGVTDKFTSGEGVKIKVPQLISLIKRGVKTGKWNIYRGGDAKHTAKVSYKGKNWEYGEHIFIIGSEREIKHLEENICKFIEVIPRRFN